VKFVSCDPGEATGYAVWPSETPGTQPEHVGTAALADFVAAIGIAAHVDEVGEPAREEGVRELVEHFEGFRLLVFEDWALYPWKLKELAWDQCRTARGIGALEYICVTAGIPTVAQGAKIKDAASAGGADALFMRPLHANRHANDAIRHGVFYQLSRVAQPA